eukprot:16211675-Heterocapsa_arctica.AAC.1
MMNHTPRSSAEPAAATSSGSSSGPPSWALNEARYRGQPDAAHRPAADGAVLGQVASAPAAGGVLPQAWAAPATRGAGS